MTNKAAVIAEVQIPGYSDDAVDKALIDLSITAEDVYTAANNVPVVKAAIKVLKSMLSTKLIREGGFEVQLSVKDRISDLQSEYGLVNISAGTLKNGSYKW